MKKIFTIILTAIASFALAPVASAQSINDEIKDKDGTTLNFPNQKTNYTIDNTDGKKVAYRKSISEPLSDGTYYIKLETFATGSAKKTLDSTPSDIILVLDLSSSMRDTYYTLNGTRMTRLAALQTVIEDFAKTVYDNNAESIAYSEGTYARDRIAIIGYDRNAVFVSDGGWVYIDDETKGVTKNGNTYAGSLITSIRNMDGDARTGTRPDHGFDMAIAELLSGTTEATSKRAGANLTVLMFTDGYPTDNNATQLGQPTGGDRNKFEYPFANKALYYADQLKQTYGAKIYSVGLITSVNENDDTWEYRNYCRVLQMMDWISSNYPSAHWTANISTLPIESASTGTGTYYNGYPGGTGTNFVLKGDNVPAPWNTEWTYNANGTQQANGNAVTLSGFDAGTTTSDGNKFTSDGYCFIVDDNTDFSSIFNAIAKQTAGTANAALTSATSNVDVVSNSFILPDDVLNATDIKSKVKVFTAKLNSITGGTNQDKTDGTYNFDTEILIPNSPDKYNLYNADGTLAGIRDVDDQVSVELQGTHGIKVTNFDYAANFCGPIYKPNGSVDSYTGHKIIILIPIKMNPDAVGGPNVETNAEGSGLYLSNGTNVIKFDSPTVSLPVNVYIEKKGLEGRESAKFMIESAFIPEGENWTVDDIPETGENGWKYVSTVFVTNSPNAVKSDEGYPMVRIKGMPATKVVGWVNPNDPTDVLNTPTKPQNDNVHTQPIQKGLIYRISEEDWSWSYTTKTGTKSVQYTVSDKIDNPFTYEDTKRDHIDVDVRHAESKVTNIFKSGVATDNRRYDDSKANTGRVNDGPAGLTNGNSGSGSSSSGGSN